MVEAVLRVGRGLPTLNGRRLAAAALLVLLIAVPLVGAASGQSYYTTFFTRVVIIALAAVGLNLVLGFGGMVSLGHALYIGVGAYAAAMLAASGVASAWAHLAVALAAGAVLALVVGSVCLRTSGLAFIMITLAFAQMGYYLLVSLKAYGGDDGLPMAARSALGGVWLDSPVAFYALCLALLLATVGGLSRLVNSRFGMVLRGAKSNARRMVAMGVPVFRYRLAAYVISAEICVVSGLLLANLTRFASPSYLLFQASGELLVMVVIGGTGTVFGPVFGAVVMLGLEQLLSNFKPGLFPSAEAVLRDHWPAVVGLFIVVATIRWSGGLYRAREAE